MGIKTEDMVKNLPPKEMTEGVDWIGILDSFDPAALSEHYLNECARRNPYYTCYGWDTPAMPVEERIQHSEYHARFDRQDLEMYVERIKTEGLTPSLYKNARMTLIKAIGSKGAHFYNLKEYDALGEFGRKKQEKEYKQFDEEWKRRLAEKEEEEDDLYLYDYVASVHEKIVRIRKGIKASDGKPMTQRDFAKFLEYPINKYIEAEKVEKWYSRSEEEESPVEDLLLERLIFRCHANPYWLYDSECESTYGNEDPNADAVLDGDEPCIYATPDVILRWIKEGKPRDTVWIDGIT